MAEEKKPKIDLKTRLQKMGGQVSTATGPAAIPVPGRGVPVPTPLPTTACDGLWSCDPTRKICLHAPKPCPDRPNADTTCASPAPPAVACTWACKTGYNDLDGDVNVQPPTATSNGCECQITNATDVPELTFKDANCDGIDGDVAKAIFVDAATGNDGNAGTRASPKKTIQSGILAAAAASPIKDVYVSKGGYGEAITPERCVAIGKEIAALLRTTRQDLRQELDAAQALAARGAEIAQAEADLAAATAEKTVYEERCKTNAEARRVLLETRARAAAALTLASDAHAAIAQERRELDPWLKKAQPLAQAEARLEELRAQKTAAEGALARLSLEEKALAERARAKKPVPSTSAEAACYEDAARWVSKATADEAVAAAALEQARAHAAKVSALAAELGDLEAGHADYTRLAQDLGKDGLLAMEIDLVGPELTELANDLLRTCHGPRFRCAIETSRLDAKGKRTVEECDVRVWDGKTGRSGLIEEFSGGEEVILGEAISLALTMFACKRTGVRGATLIRDESGAALDPQNARAYIAMLRRAAAFLECDKILLVSHSVAVQQMCDARVLIEDGQLKVAA